MGWAGFRGRRRRYAFLNLSTRWRVSTVRYYADGDMRHFWRISSPIALSRSRSVRLCYKSVRSVTSGPVGISAPPRPALDRLSAKAQNHKM
jgi:hypothetical protein